MKKIIPILLLFATMIFLLPFSGLIFNSSRVTLDTTSTGDASSSKPPETPEQILPFAAEDEQNVFKIYNESTGNVDTVAIRDYVIGSVAAEMPMSYHDEALKAQAVASLSYAMALKERSFGGDPNLGGAHFSANPSQMQGYMSDETMRSFWGDSYEQNKARLESLVDSLDGMVLTYDNNYALTCYHAFSNGKTETSANMWGEALPYLVSVDSPFDITADDYSTTLTFSVAEVQNKLTAAALISPSGEPSQWFGTPDVTSAGYVSTITVNDTAFTGTQIRHAFGLRSSSFDIIYTENYVFEITSRGYGHGVGLSQFGANSMALAGMSYTEILLYYFPGTTAAYI